MKGRFRNILLLFFCVVLFAGCTVRIIYNHLDWIIPWYVSDYINLNSGQDSLFDRRLMAQLKWHRVTQLTSYSKSLRQLKHAVNNGPKCEDLDRFHNQMRKYWQDLVRQISPDLAGILSNASDDQIKEFLENLKKRNEKYKERYIDLSEEELRTKKIDRMKTFLKFCMGDINQEQEKIIQRWSKKLQNISTARFHFFQKFQKCLTRILGNRKDEETFKKDLEKLLCFKRKDWPPDLRQIAAHNRDLTKGIFIEILDSMSTDQREYLNGQLDDLANVFDELAAQRS